MVELFCYELRSEPLVEPPVAEVVDGIEELGDVCRHLGRAALAALFSDLVLDVLHDAGHGFRGGLVPKEFGVELFLVEFGKGDVVRVQRGKPNFLARARRESINILIFYILNS